MSKLSIVLLVVLMIGGGLFIWSKNQSRSDCENRALAAAVDTYPIGEYPDAAQRAQLQEDYKQRYISTSCQ